MERKNSDNECPVRKSMQIFAGKWTLLIIYQINSRIIRYGELKRAIPGISEKMLINELKFLCDRGLIAKKTIPGSASTCRVFAYTIGRESAADYR